MTRSEPGQSTQECEILCVGTGLALYSRFVQRILRRYANFELLLGPQVPNKFSMLQCAMQLQQRGLDIGGAWRVTRALVLQRLVMLDCEQSAPLATITQAMTELAETALDVACQQVQADLDAVHGTPMTDKNERAAFWVVGMGKLGARELNVSSDIDLIYVYSEDGETTGNALGRGRISNHEYFGKAVRGVNQLLADVTEHGFVFRIDLALRPNGNSGPSAVSLGALEEYFMVQGREWERFAWLKSRVVAPCSAVAHSAKALRGVVLPFVFRRYLDYNVFESLRVLHRQIREHANRRSAGRPERANDIKLSRGGIREIEFTVQLLQVVRGGQFPELRTRPTLDALKRLCTAGLMLPATMQVLAQAYVFLRQVEHRIQYLDDQQTHVLPSDDADIDWIAQTMGLANGCLFLAALNTHRETVALEFDRLLGGTDGCKGCDPSKQPSPDIALETLVTQLPPRLRERVAQWQKHPRVLALQDASRNRLVRLLQRTGQMVNDGLASEDAALRMADWMEPLLRRESYLALLIERPQVHARLLRMLGAARWPARYLMKHPGVIDELADASLLEQRFDALQFCAELTQRAQSLHTTGQDDDETLMLLLRRAQNAEMFRILVRDIEGHASVEQVADELSALADAVLDMTSRWCWDRLKNRHIDIPQFAVLAYGKLGGKELGYGSDLDIVFVYDDAHEQASMVYSALVRKLITWLSTKTAEGDLYEIDTALRPNGNSGLLVSTMDAFANYQTQRGSNTAWVWEHQAMTRARCVLGSASVHARFDAVRQAVLCAPRDVHALAQEIVSMRERVRSAHRCPVGKFDIKHSAGGMLDVEFAVQYLVLAHTAQHPSLGSNVGNIGLLERAEAAGLLPTGMGHKAASAYRALRHAQHMARLDEQTTQLDATQLVIEKAAVLALWLCVFGGGQQAQTTQQIL